MKTQMLTLLFIWVGALFMPAQKYSVNVPPSSLEVLGTSSVHDWEIEAENFSGTASISEESGLAIDQLTFEVNVADLKSAYSAMDKNTRKALKADKFPTIHYELMKTTSTKRDGNNYSFQTRGKLTIAGHTNEVNMNVKAVKEHSKVNFSGQLPMKMTDYEIEPPTAVFGTIKTGNEVTVKFNIEYKN